MKVLSVHFPTVSFGSESPNLTHCQAENKEGINSSSWGGESLHNYLEFVCKEDLSLLHLFLIQSFSYIGMDLCIFILYFE
jgi:hypothetical protein